MLLKEKGYCITSYSPVRRDSGATCLAGSMVPRARAEREERVRQHERMCECVSTSVCASASARAYVRVRQRERMCECVSASGAKRASA